MLRAKYYYNQPMFHEAIQKIKVARFLWTTVYIALSGIGFAITSTVKSFFLSEMLGQNTSLCPVFTPE